MAPDDIRFSRRGLLAGATALGVGSLVPRAFAAAATDLRHGRSTQAYAGCYTPNGGGIYQFDADLASGRLTQVKIYDGIQNPSWLAFGPGGKTLYATNEIDNFQGTTSGSVSSFSVNSSTGALTPLNVVSAQGGAPVYLNLHPSGKFLFVANYDGGSVAVLPIRADGSLGNATDVKLDSGNVGPTTAADAPPGSFADSGHDAPHAHFIHSDPGGRFVLHVDLGQDRIYSWRFDATAGTLSPAATPFVTVGAGDGPRHLAFHPNGRLVYLVTEESSTLTVFAYNGATGALTALQSLSALPDGFVGTSYGAEIAVSADGRFVHVSNRLHDSIGTFAIDGRGTLTPVGFTETHGDYPRSFTIDPTGAFLYAANQRSDALTVFRIDPLTGKPQFTGAFVPVGSPASLVFRI